MKKITKYLRENKAMLAMIFALAWPAMIEQTMQTIVLYADAAMVGRLGAYATASVGLTTPVSWLVNSPLFAIAIGFLACIAKAVGAKDEATARSAAMQSTFIVLIMGSLLALVTVALSPFIPGWMNASEEICADASRYFAIICMPMVFRASTIIFGAAIRASGDTRTPMLVSILMNGINIVFNYFLIFATREVSVFGMQFTMPGAGLGVTGAAIASAISYVASGIMMFLLLMRNSKLSFRGTKLHLDKPVMAQCIRIGLPVAFTRVGVTLGQVVFLSQVSTLGPIALAAHSLGLTVEEAIYLPGYGMQVAASTLSGHALGERNEKKLMHVSGLITMIAAILMGFTGAFLFVFPRQMMSIFTTDPSVIQQGIGILRIVAFSEPIYAVGIILEGVFNGVGDTRAPFVISIFSMWGIRILFTYLSVNVWGFGLNAVWMCMVGDNVVRAILLGIRYFRGTWKQTLDLNRAA